MDGESSNTQLSSIIRSIENICKALIRHDQFDLTYLMTKLKNSSKIRDNFEIFKETLFAHPNEEQLKETILTENSTSTIYLTVFSQMILMAEFLNFCMIE